MNSMKLIGGMAPLKKKILTRTRMMNEKEPYSENIGVRLKLSQKKRLAKWSAHLNLPPAVFIRSLLLNRLDELEKQVKK